MIINLPRGTRDYIKYDMALKTKIEEIARGVALSFGGHEITTPMFEHTELFLRGVGETTDIVNKEMYTFLDKSDRSLTLKPEGTAGVVRAYIENKLFNEPKPMKLFYVTPCFRYEKPQKGRLRQHHQFGFEIFGVDDPMGEVEIITLLTTLFDTLNLNDRTLHINSIGGKESRDIYNKNLLDYLKANEEGLCDTCKDRLVKNPMRILDCKNKTCQSIAKGSPRTIDYLTKEDNKHFETLKKHLDELGIKYIVDTGIVRGLDYYTNTVFEFIDSDDMTICGGGRYDNLVEEISGKHKISALGFGIGIERIMLALEKEGVQLVNDIAPDIYVGFVGDTAKIKAYEIAKHLRDSGIKTEYNLSGKGINAQMKYANKIGAKNLVLIGDQEIETNQASLKNMMTGEEKQINIDKIKNYIGEKNEHK